MSLVSHTPNPVKTNMLTIKVKELHNIEIGTSIVTD